MDDGIKTWLYDIGKAIEEIEFFLDGGPKCLADYSKNVLVKRAVERNVEIIGEATNRILKANSTVPISNARKIVDVRNRIVHGYDTVSDETIWDIAVRHLPVLKSEIARLLQ